MHGRKGRYRNKRRGLRVNCFCAFGNNVQAFSSSLPRTSKRYSARVSTVGVSKGVNGVSRSWNCHPPKIAPHPWNFLTPCFAISKIFPPLRRSRTEEMPFPPEKLNERSTMGKVFSLSLEPFVLEHVRFVFLEERAFQADPAVWAPPFWKLDTNIRFVEYYLGENGVQDFYTTIFNGFFVYLFQGNLISTF